MAVMKRLIYLLLSALILTVCSPPAFFVFAESGTFAVAADDDVYFYSQPDERSGLFLIPHTYYVQVLSDGEPFCRVSYLEDAPPYRKIEGYCLKNRLTFVDFLPERPFLKRQISATYSLTDGTPLPPNGDVLQSIQVDYVYYGSYSVGSSLYYYVYGNEQFGYLPAEKELEYEHNSDYLSSVSGDTVDSTPLEKDGKLSGLQIFFICLLCVSAIAVAIFVLRGKRTPPSRDSSDF